VRPQPLEQIEVADDTPDELLLQSMLRRQAGATGPAPGPGANAASCGYDEENGTGTDVTTRTVRRDWAKPRPGCTAELNPDSSPRTAAHAPAGCCPDSDWRMPL